MEALAQLRKAELYVSTAKAALMSGRSVQWVRDNKHRFTYRRKKTRQYPKGGLEFEFEISSVLLVWNQLNSSTEPSGKLLKAYQ